MAHPVYPVFPENPEPGDLFPDPFEESETQFEYLSDQVGWVKKIIVLQEKDSGDPIWPGRIIAENGGGHGGGG